MKKSMIKNSVKPLVIGVAVAVQAGAVMADATVYGKLNLTMQNNNFDYLDRPQKDNWTLESNASRLGVKGKAGINDDLDAVFKMEFEVFADGGYGSCNGSNNTFCPRNIYAGLSSKKYGMLYAGRNDTVMKMTASGTDLFDDLILGDITNYMVGENRESNSILYTSPIISGFTFSTSTILGEQTGVNNASNKQPYHNSIQKNSGLFDSMSSAVKYDVNAKTWVALAQDINVENADITRLVGQTKVGNFTFDAQWQTAGNHYKDQNADGKTNSLGDGMLISSTRGYGLALNNPTPPAGAGNGAFYSGIEKQDAWMVNGMYQSGPWSYKAQVGQSDSKAFSPNAANKFESGSARDFKATQLALGVDYALNKNVTVFGYAAQIDVDTGKAKALIKDASLQTAGIGLEVKF